MNSSEPKITQLIRMIRDQRVILDADLAALYGVPTKRFNEAFKRSKDHFPIEFAFQLTAGESVAINWSQTATSHSQDTDIETIKSNSSQFAMSSRKHRGATYRPWAFTEHGALMAANILRSPPRPRNERVHHPRLSAHARGTGVQRRNLETPRRN